MESKWMLVIICGLVLVVAVGVFHSCGGGGGTTPTSTTTISAKLYSGTLDPINPTVSKAVTPGAPLVGYQLYCITFSTPPLSGTGTSGTDGSVTVTIEAGSADVGCFILDTNNTSVASLIFTNSDLTQSGQTIAASGTADFGIITVSLEDGVATATIPSGVTITNTPSGMTCPAGTWSFTSEIHKDLCAEGTVLSGTVWIASTPEGGYAVSYSVYNDSSATQCITHSRSGIVLTWDNTTATSDPFPDWDQVHCSGQMVTITLTPDSACSTADMVVTFSDCPENCDCDTLNFTTTRQ